VVLRFRERFREGAGERISRKRAAAFSARREALHDMFAGTVVLNAKASPADVEAGGDTMPVTAGVMITLLLFFIIPFVAGTFAAIAIPAYRD